MRMCIVLLVAACGGKPTPTGPTPGSGSDVGVVKDTRTEIEKRRDAACDNLEPKLFDCAIADATAEHKAGRLSKADYDSIMKPDMKDAFRKDWDKQCKDESMNSRQVRVLEVCFKEETECGPLGECLKNLQEPAGGK